MSTGAALDRRHGWSAGQCSAWVLRGAVGLIFLVLVCGLLGYQASEQARRNGLVEQRLLLDAVCKADITAKSDSQVLAQALRCVAAGVERAPLTATNRQDVQAAVQLLIEVLKQAMADGRRGASHGLEL